MALTIKPEFQNKVLAFNNSAIPLGQRSQVDLTILLVLAYQAKRDDYVSYFENPPTLEELLGNAPGGPGGTGPTGTNGWSWVPALEADGDRVVIRIADWQGGTGSKPAAGGYIGGSGIVSTKAAAINVRGLPGTGTGGGGTFESLTGVPKNNAILKSYIDSKVGARRFNIVDYGADPTFTNDSTDAIQAALDACWLAGGGVVWCPIGHYKIAKALPAWADRSSSNPICQIRVPLSSTYANLCRISLVGESWTVPQIMVVNNNSATQVVQGGVIFESTIRGTADNVNGNGAASVIGSGWIIDDFGPLNFTHFAIDNICVRTNAHSGATYLPSTMTAVDLRLVAQTDIGRILTDITAPITASVEPAFDVYGLRFPSYNNRGFSNVDALVSFGYTWGVEMAEHAFINYLTVAGCGVGVHPGSGGHRRHINKMQAEGCKYGVYLGASEESSIHITSYGAEHNTGAGHWYSFVKDVYVDEYMEGERLHITHARVTLLPRFYVANDNASRVSIDFINGIKVADGCYYSGANAVQLDGLGRRNVSWLVTYKATGNKTVSIVNPFRGCDFKIFLEQDATGGRTLTLPANSVFMAGYAVDTAPNAITKISGWYDGVNYRWKSE